MLFKNEETNATTFKIDDYSNQNLIMVLDNLKDKYLICFEIGESEAERVTSYAYKYLNNPNVIVKKDLEKRDRMIFIHNFE